MFKLINLNPLWNKDMHPKINAQNDEAKNDDIEFKDKDGE